MNTWPNDGLCNHWCCSMIEYIVIIISMLCGGGTVGVSTFFQSYLII